MNKHNKNENGKFEMRIHHLPKHQNGCQVKFATKYQKYSFYYKTLTNDNLTT